MFNTNFSGIREVAGLGSVYLTGGPASIDNFTQEHGVQLHEGNLAQFLGLTHLPAHPDTRVWTVSDLDSEREYTRKGNSLTLDWASKEGGLINPPYGGYTHCVVGEVDPKSGHMHEIHYDFIMISDGPQSEILEVQHDKHLPYGKSGVLIMNLVEIDGVMHAIMFLQFRPLFLDPEKGNLEGEWVLTTAGGFGKEDLTSKQQAAVESGSELGVSQAFGYRELGVVYPNRAKDVTPVKMALQQVELMGKIVPEEEDDEELKTIFNGFKVVVPLSKILPGKDSLVNDAVQLAQAVCR